MTPLTNSPLPCSAPRWHVEAILTLDGATAHVVVRRCSAEALPIVVRPSHAGFAAAVALADAINRAYAIEPVSGFDVAGLLGLDLRTGEHEAPAYAPRYTSAERGQRERAERRLAAPISAAGNAPPH